MNPIRPSIRALVVALGAFCFPGTASDHADPMSLNPFQLQADPVANITDLHAFVVDAAGRPVLDPGRVGDGDQLIVSLCVRRRLLPWQVAGIENDVSKYSFRVHLDLNPDVRFFDPVRTRDGRDYPVSLARAGADVAAATQARDEAFRSTNAALRASAQANLDRLLAVRGGLVAQYQADASMQGLYGGILDNPGAIAEEALLDFRLGFAPDGENSEIVVTEPRIDGIAGEVNLVSEARVSRAGTNTVVPARAWKPGAINIQSGIFDDPFIFPRFFRGNVVGIVASIPLRLIRRPDGSPVTAGPVLLWATTHRPDGRQSDHVGRSLRTQLPRFGYLNGLHPSKHVAEILRVHDRPTLMENILTTFIAPLEAHRHYDGAPDVMIYDLRKPARFPNGRWLEDDVAGTLADAGETILLELAHAESRQFPRARVNDKPFRTNFPYLAPRWTALELQDHAAPGSMLPGGFVVPDAPDGDAIGLPTFVPAVWRSLWLGVSIGIALVGVLAFVAVRGLFSRFILGVIAIAGLVMVQPVRAAALQPMDRGFMQQPQDKLVRLLLGGGLIGALGLVSLYSAGLRRGLAIAAREQLRPLGEQGEVLDDRQYTGSTFREVSDAVLGEPYYSGAWGESGQKPLPVHTSTFGSVAQGLFNVSQRFLFRDAAARTLKSRADLRWGGPDRRGVQRLIHPNGVCLAGVWRIDEDTAYTGFFARGSMGLVVARYSSGLALRRGEVRTLSMVGKLYPGVDANERAVPASFITQEELGGSTTASICDALLRNAPEVTPWRRGFGLGTLFLTVFAFMRVDRRIMIRQLYEIAELGKPAGQATRCPEFMQLKVVSAKVGGDEQTADFREEVLAQIYDPGVATARRKLVFEIQVSDAGRMTGWLNKRLVGADWRPIGRIEFDAAAVSHNGDFVIHFHHPKWRADRNDPDSVTGPGRLGRALEWLVQKIGVVTGLFIKRR